MKNRKHISELEFGKHMLSYVRSYPLEVVSSICCEDEDGIFYVPCIRDYCDSEQEYTTGSKQGYSSRQQLLACIGRCWDKAEDYYKSLLET